MAPAVTSSRQSCDRSIIDGNYIGLLPSLLALRLKGTISRTEYQFLEERSIFQVSDCVTEHAPL